MRPRTSSRSGNGAQRAGDVDAARPRVVKRQDAMRVVRNVCNDFETGSFARKDRTTPRRGPADPLPTRQRMPIIKQ